MSEHAVDIGQVQVLMLGVIEGDEVIFDGMTVMLTEEQAAELELAMALRDPRVTMRLSWGGDDDTNNGALVLNGDDDTNNGALVLNGDDDTNNGALVLNSGHTDGSLRIWQKANAPKPIRIGVNGSIVYLSTDDARRFARAVITAVDATEAMDTPVTPIGTVAIMELGQIEGEQGAYDGVGLMMSRAQVRMLAAAMSHADPCITMHPVWTSENK